MMGILGGLFGGIFKWLLGLLTGKTKPKIEDYADSNARAQEQLGQQEAANELHTKAADARGDVDDAIVRANEGPDKSDAAVAKRLRERFPDDFA